MSQTYLKVGNDDRLKHRAAMLSLGFNLVSTGVKIVAAVMTGSLGLLSESIHSATDVLSSGIALLSVRAAAVPADEEHPYGHGKIESLAGFGEAILLFGVVIYVVIEAIHRMLSTSMVSEVGLGLAVMAASAAGALVVGLYVRKVAIQTHSMALASNAQHLFVDSVTSFGVLGTLGLVSATGWNGWDPLMALAMAVWMAWGAFGLSKQAFHDLIDVRLTDPEIARIEAILGDCPDVKGWHRLRTRRVGNERQIDLHVVLPREWSLVRAHDLADAIEQRIERDLAPAHATIHVDPEDPDGEEPR